MSTKTKKRIIIYVAVVIVLYLLIYTVPSVSSLFKGTYSAKYGQLRVEDEATGYIVRNEIVYVSTSGGSVNRFAKEGDLVRKGTTIMEVTGSSEEEPSHALADIVSELDEHKVSTSDFVAKDGGIVSFYVDGYEEELNSDNVAATSFDTFNKIKKNDVTELSKRKIKGGEPAFKIIDKDRWYLVAYVDLKDKDRYLEGSTISVEFRELGKKNEPLSVDMQVKKVKKQSGKLKVVLECSRYFEEYASIRVAKVNLVTSDVTGIIIDNDSITEKKDKKGVYVRDKKGNDVFVPVRVIATDGKESAIAESYFFDSDGERVETVSPYDDILKNPAKAREAKTKKSK